MIIIIRETNEMRRLQKEYFRVRSSFILSKCKSQECKVDKLISDFCIMYASTNSQQIKVDNIQSKIKF
jgi:hypothetical protein